MGTRTGAKRVVSTPELAARREVFALGGDALEVVSVVLETVPCLVGIWEAGCWVATNEPETFAAM